ncbi:zf-HC2 domain-containing protein [Pseudonocardia sp. GCM10023141]|uniref:zf-HC2 domain-containing protein n=1 Tax=Pseudonocardia sp. GCM10023141 TaxID=3252653 RepID=UPI003616215A
MRCADCRDAISARLDGEDLPGEDAAVDAHLQGCAGCRAHAERLAQVTRLARLGPVQETPDLVAAVLAAAPPPPRQRRTGAVRLALGGVGIGQCALAVSEIVAAGGAHHGGPELAGATAAHLVNESSAWNLALAVAFLWVAAGTSRISGLVPVIAAFVGILTVLSAFDVISGRVDAERLLSHALVVAGLVLLVVMQRLTRNGGGGTDVARPVPGSPATDADPDWAAPYGRPDVGGTDGLRAAAPGQDAA